MAKMNAIEAGRKGGRSRSAKKLAAARQNGFQPCKNVEPAPQQEPSAPEPAAVPVAKPAQRPVFIPALSRKEDHDEI